MKTQTSALLRQRREVLSRRLPPIEETLQGSLIERYKRCGNARCKCAQGPGHGPKYYLSTSRSGERPQMEYVPQGLQPRVSAMVENHRLMREILREISEINRELLARREPL